MAKSRKRGNIQNKSLKRKNKKDTSSSEECETDLSDKSKDENTRVRNS